MVSPANWPIAAWVVLILVAVFLGEYIALQVRRRRHSTAAHEAQRRLVRFATALRNYALGSGQRLPTSLRELGLPESERVAYRPSRRIDEDERLILVHDREPTQKVLEFPSLRDGRGLVFCGGRLHVVTEEAFEKLLAADDALRERLGLAACREEGGG
jgi:hypothetical protein